MEKQLEKKPKSKGKRANSRPAKNILKPPPKKSSCKKKTADRMPHQHANTAAEMVADEIAVNNYCILSAFVCKINFN